MRTENLNYHLPVELIAQQPAKVRSNSKLLVLDRSTGKLTDSRFGRIGNFLPAGGCLVLNDTKVLPARFFCRRASGGKLEGLFLAENTPGSWDVMLKGASKVKRGERLTLKDKEDRRFCQAEVVERTGSGRFLLKIETNSEAGTILNKIGFPPLPPYIKRGRDLGQAAIDKVRYQTVYAKKAGAVAAPTAGLHFTNRLIEKLKNRGIHLAYITLHTGAGTFKPITAETLEEYEIHAENFCLDEENARIINTTKEKGGRIIAVGTTSVRTLETMACRSGIKAGGGTTKLFIKPGYEFRMVDAMVTNFHLPRSTLLALVAAFAGLENILTAYRYAMEQRYRFYSYGDAMLIV